MEEDCKTLLTKFFRSANFFQFSKKASKRWEHGLTRCGYLGFKLIFFKDKETSEYTLQMITSSVFDHTHFLNKHGEEIAYYVNTNQIFVPVMNNEVSFCILKSDKLFIRNPVHLLNKYRNDVHPDDIVNNVIGGSPYYIELTINDQLLACNMESFNISTNTIQFSTDPLLNDIPNNARIEVKLCFLNFKPFSVVYNKIVDNWNQLEGENVFQFDGILHNKENNTLIFTLPLHPPNLSYLKKAYKRFVYAPGGNLVDVPEGIISLQFITNYVEIVNELLNIVMSTNSNSDYIGEYLKIEQDVTNNRIKLLCTNVPDTNYRPMEEVLQLQLPLNLEHNIVKTIGQQIDKITKNGLSGLTTEELKKYFQLIDLYRPYAFLQGINCHICSNNSSKYIYKDVHPICGKCHTNHFGLKKQ